MRRVLNSFLQFLEADDSDSLILAATNHQEALDPALFRRFDDVIRYGLPDADQVEQLAKNRLNSFGLSCVAWDKVRAAAAGLSNAEVTRACMEAAKVAVLAGQDAITTENLLSTLCERTAILSRDTSS
jgi:ATP-dependent 26S proteasome regulatory subunit